jgi:hypothetical protein
MANREACGMPTMFHLAPILIEVGSVVLPGNYGRIIRAVGMKHPQYNRETLIEGVRKQRYGGKPSRLSSCFACPTEATARGYRDAMTKKGGSFAQVLYEVEKVEHDAPEHLGDFNVLMPMAGYSMEQIAHRYWSADLKTNIKEQPGLQCEEIVTASPLRVLRRID